MEAPPETDRPEGRPGTRREQVDRTARIPWVIATWIRVPALATVLVTWITAIWTV